MKHCEVSLLGKMAEQLDSEEAILDNCRPEYPSISDRTASVNVMNRLEGWRDKRTVAERPETCWARIVRYHKNVLLTFIDHHRYSMQ